MRRLASIAAFSTPLIVLACRGEVGTVATSSPDGGITTGSDAATDAADAGADADVACTLTPGPNAAPLARVTSVARADAGVTVTVPDGFRLAGKVSLPTFTGVRYTVSSIEGADPVTGGRLFTHPDASGAYAFTLPAGDYPLDESSVGYFDDGASVTSHVTEVVRVCGDATHDVTLPALPALVTVQITVDHLESLAIGPGDAVTVTLADAGHVYSASATVAVNATTASVSVHAPLGQKLAASVLGHAAGDVTLTGDATLTVPEGIGLRGQVVSADPLIAYESVVACVGTKYQGPIGPMNPHWYALMFPAGTTCDAQAAVAIDTGEDMAPARAFGVMLSPVVHAGYPADSPDFAAPAVIADFGRFDVTVVDARGALVMNAGVSARSKPQTATAWTWTTSGGTGTTGHATLLLPPAAYELIVEGE